MSDRTDIAIVGAGAAGLMTAIFAARALAERFPGGARPGVTLFDSRKKIGAKILMSGGTRCNVTNEKVSPSDYHGGTSHFIKHVFSAFPPERAIGFFAEIGVELVLEPGGKYFPISHSGRTVLDALVREAESRGVTILRGCKIHSIEKSGDAFSLDVRAAGEKGPVEIGSARTVALCTGGLSYPETGSDGAGLEIAKALGHTIIPTAPALTPLMSIDPDWRGLGGLSLEARLEWIRPGHKTVSTRGGFLFTHFGFSGPAGLDISRHVAIEGAQAGTLAVNFLPDDDPAGFKRSLGKVRATPESLLGFLCKRKQLPRRFAEVLLKKCGLGSGPPLSRPVSVIPALGAAQRLSRGWQDKITAALFRNRLAIEGVYGYKKAEVTAGGVDLKEVAFATMESKKVKGLYFAGEILDVDGRIGGFNFQWSWSSGAVAGRAMAKALC